MVIGFKQVSAAGLLIADGRFGGKLKIKEHSVKVTINNGIAITEVTQIFQNMERRQLEALYTFPIPKGASVSDFSMWIRGKEMIGEVVEKKRARQIYESYKKRNIDPGLLEQVDFKRFEMRIFPIAAGASQKVKITYSQELDVDNDWITYLYPLATTTVKNLDSKTTDKFSITLDINSAIPITSLKSPSHQNDFVINKINDDYYQASLEIKEGDLNKDVVLSAQLKRPLTGIDVVTSKTKGEDGFFYLTLTAGKELEKLDVGMDYLFVLDISGSMRMDGKITQSKNTVGAFLEELGDKDRFDLITFNTMPKPVFKKLEFASPENIDKAKKRLNRIETKGGTSVLAALRLAYRYAEEGRSLNIILMSDGMDGQTYPRSLVDLINQNSASGRSKVFCVGVGNEINKPLLKRVAQDSGGFAAFISNGDNFQRQAKSFKRKLLHPVASNLSIELKNIGAYDITPSTLPNLYHGFPVRIYGRYKKSAESTITINANIQGKALNKSVNIIMPNEDHDNPEIERMWAFKKIQELQKGFDESNNQHPNIEKIIRLGEGYSIVSKYTSFLVLENDNEYKRWKISRRNALRQKRDRRAMEKLKVELEKLREKATTNIIPNSNQKELIPSKPTQKTVKAPKARSRKHRSRNFSFGGSGPVNPFLMIAILFGFFFRKYNLKINRK